MTQMTKEQAREETIRRWRALPLPERRTFAQAEAFAAALSVQLQFRTMGDTRRVILGWISRDMEGFPPWGHVRPERNGP